MKMVQFLGVGFLLFAGPLRGGPLLDDWRVRNPLPTASTLYGVAYGNDRFIAVGDRGTILISSDGFAWLEQIELTNFFSTITFGNGIFAASGSEGISTSVDGISWTRRMAPRVNELAYLNELFVGVGNSMIFSSRDGVSWTATPIETQAFARLTGVTYARGMFVVVGTEPSYEPEPPPAAVVLISTNGSDWISRDPGMLSSPYKIAFGNEVFVSVGAGGRIWSSPDAMTWTEAATGSASKAFWDLGFADGLFVAVGDPSAIYTSNDGQLWTLRTTNIFSSFQSVTHGRGKFFTVGSGGGVLESRDGTNWVARNRGPQPRLLNCTYADGRFVAVGGGGGDVGSFILTSDDGFSWRAQPFPDVTYLRGVAYGNGMFVAAGATGAVFTSSNGGAWNCQDSHQPNWNFGDMTYALGQFVAVGTDSFDNGGILTSSNGIDWSVRFTGVHNFLFRIVYGNGLYVAVGGNILVAADPSIILTSTDGIHWTPRDAGIPSTLMGVAYGNGLFVAVRYAGLTSDTVITSPDGITWTKQSLSSFDDLVGVMFGEGQFVAVALNGSIFTSTNGVAWRTRNSHTHRDLLGGAFGNGTFVAVGDAGTIVQTAGLSPRFHPEGTRLSDDGVWRMIIETQQGINFT